MARWSTTLCRRALPFAVVCLWAQCLFPEVAGKVVDYLPQGFFFDWTPQGQTPPVPATAQCDTIHIAWSRGTATGPNPTSPYFLQVYTSTFVTPFIIPVGDQLEFDWVVPFIPGTLYEICMFDSKGVTGGCQAVYSVYQAPNTTLSNPPICTNLTYPRPEQELGVNAIVDSGPISQFGWVDQCTDIQVTPTNGTPPFYFTVAPALHPPFNLTSTDNSPINWTVSLSYGMPFFISLMDSSGMAWSNGPLHSGGGGPTNCLSGEAPSQKSTVASAVAIGSGVGGLVVGLIAGILGAGCFSYWSRRRSTRPDTVRKSSNMSISSLSNTGHYRDIPSPPVAMSTENSRDRLMRDGSYHIEPFVLPSDREFGVAHAPTEGSSNTVYTPGNTSPGQSASQRPHHSPTNSRSSQAGGPMIPTIPPPPSSHRMSPTGTAPFARDEPRSSQVFVVHHDGGRAPVTVYTPEGTEVVELPPRYTTDRMPADDSNRLSDSGQTTGSGSGSRTLNSGNSPLPWQQQRQVGPSPQKPAESSPSSRRVVN